MLFALRERVVERGLRVPAFRVDGAPYDLARILRVQAGGEER